MSHAFEVSPAQYTLIIAALANYGKDKSVFIQREIVDLLKDLNQQVIDSKN